MRALRLLCLALAAATLGACDTSPAAAPQAVSSMNSTIDDPSARSIEAQLIASWAATGPETGGFRKIHRWDEPESLYATTWNLCLRSVYGIATPNLSVSATAARLHVLLTGQEDPAPAIQRALLVTIALQWLRQPLPRTDLRAILDASRAGDLYAYVANEPASWPATQAALEIYAALGDAPPPGVTAKVRSALGAATTGENPGNFLDIFLPLWTVADRVLPDVDRSSFRVALATVLQRERARVGPEPGGPSVAILKEINEIAAANAIPLPPQLVSLKGLETPDGYLSLFGDSTSGDPQVTCLAASLGFKPAPQLAETMARTAQPAGWVAWSENPPDPESSLFALLDLRALGHPWNETALKNQVMAWLHQLQTAGLAGVDLLSSAFYVVALAHELNVPDQAWIAGAVNRLMSSDDAQLDAWVIALAALIQAEPPAAAPIRTRMAGVDPKTMAQAWALYLAGEIFKQPAWHARALRAAGLCRSSAAFARAIGGPVPDLLSTAAALQLIGAGGSQREAAISLFGTYPRYWIWPPDSGAGNVSDPQSLYLGLVTSGKTNDITGVLLARFS